MKKLLLTGFWLVMASAFMSWADTMTLTTYYPAPSGRYKAMYVADTLGVGTSSPQAELDVNGDIQLNNNLVNSFGDGNVAWNTNWFGAGPGWKYLTTGYASRIEPQGASGIGGLAFFTHQWGTAGTSLSATAPALYLSPVGNIGIGTSIPVGLLDVNRKLTVLSGGNVGIGTVVPVGLLDVNRKFMVLSGGNVGIGTTAIPRSLQVVGNPADNYHTAAFIRQDTGYGVALGAQAGVSAGAIRGAHFDLSTGLGDGTPQPLALNAPGGNVGIGTDFPLVKLDVQGGQAVIRGKLAPASGVGLELSYDSATSRGEVVPFDRTAAAYRALRLEGNPVYLNGLSANNVGIGTSVPAAKLEVSGGLTKTTGGLIIETRSGSDPASPQTGQIWLRTDI